MGVVTRQQPGGYRAGAPPFSPVTVLPMPSPSIYNVPNALTTVRFALAIAVVILIPMEKHWTAMIVFLIAVSTDWMDGYWARKYGQVTKLGRIFDPFVDKIIICGSFIALVEIDDSPVQSWMATTVVARELLVTSLRGIIEGAGGDFSASWLGKWKMVVQCAAVVGVLLSFVMSPAPEWLEIATTVFLWGAILITVYSGVDYSLIAARVMQSDSVLRVDAEVSATNAAASDLAASDADSAADIDQNEPQREKMLGSPTDRD